MYKTRSIKAIVRIAFIVMCAGAVLSGCRDDHVSGNTMTASEQLMEGKAIKDSKAYEESGTYAKRPVQEVTISAVGDIMMHSYQLQRAYNPKEDYFDFAPSFAPMKDRLSQPDYTVGNLETTLAGKKSVGDVPSASEENRESYVGGYSGYPRFNSPDELVACLKNTGFDLVSTANNHALDQGINGLIRTIEVCDSMGLNHVGTYINGDEDKHYKRVRIKGMTFAFVNYTYGTNGIAIENIDQHIDSLHNYNEDYYSSLIQSVIEAKASPVDFVVVMMHYGFEYKSVPSSVQKDINEALFDAGADIILGGHPHTLQPIEVYRQWKGKVLDSPKLVINSLGNFIASQRNVDQFKADTDIGVVLTLHFEKDDLDKPRLSGFDLLPTFTHWQRDAIMTLPVDAEVLDDSPYYLTPWDKNRIKYAYNETTTFLTQYLKQGDIEEEEMLDGDGTHRYHILQ